MSSGGDGERTGIAEDQPRGETLRVYLHYGVNGLQVLDALLGEGLTIQHPGRRITLLFPRKSDDFVHETGLDESLIDLSNFTVRISSEHGDLLNAVRDVRAIRAVIEFDTDLPARDLEPPLSSEITDFLFHLALEGSAAASRAISSYLNHIRVLTGQHWLGMHGGVPEVLGHVLVTRLSGKALPVSVSLEPMFIRVGARLVDVELHESAVRLMESEEPPLAESLLADASFLGQSGFSNRKQALLMAAIACEVKVKQTLRRSANADQSRLVELLIDKPRDFSMSAISLFEHGTGAVIGRDLKVEDRDLWKAVDRLFRRRNAVAHKGDDVTSEEVGESLDAAKRAFAWLDDVAGTTRG